MAIDIKKMLSLPNAKKPKEKIEEIELPPVQEDELEVEELEGALQAPEAPWSDSSEAEVESPTEEIQATPEAPKKRTGRGRERLNANSLKFITDSWGCCAKVKKELIAGASRCAGHEDKMEIYRNALEEILGHAEDKHADAMLVKAKRNKERLAAKEAAGAE